MSTSWGSPPKIRNYFLDPISFVRLEVADIDVQIAHSPISQHEAHIFCPTRARSCGLRGMLAWPTSSCQKWAATQQGWIQCRCIRVQLYPQQFCKNTKYIYPNMLYIGSSLSNSSFLSPRAHPRGNMAGKLLFLWISNPTYKNKPMPTHVYDGNEMGKHNWSPSLQGFFFFWTNGTRVCLFHWYWKRVS